MQQLLFCSVLLTALFFSCEKEEEEFSNGYVKSFIIQEFNDDTSINNNAALKEKITQRVPIKQAQEIELFHEVNDKVELRKFTINAPAFFNNGYYYYQKEDDRFNFSSKLTLSVSDINFKNTPKDSKGYNMVGGDTCTVTLDLQNSVLIVFETNKTKIKIENHLTNKVQDVYLYDLTNNYKYIVINNCPTKYRGGNIFTIHFNESNSVSISQPDNRYYFSSKYFNL